MTAPIALGPPRLSPSPPDFQRSDKALTAPTTPGHRLPVVDKSKVDPQLRKAAEGMEAMFLNFMMTAMRQTVPNNEMDLENGASKIYRNMLDAETSERVARSGGVGLADQIIAYLEPQRYTLPRGQAVPVAQPKKDASVDPTVSNRRSTGGTDEGRPNRE